MRRRCRNRRLSRRRRKERRSWVRTVRSSLRRIHRIRSRVRRGRRTRRRDSRRRIRRRIRNRGDNGAGRLPHYRRLRAQARPPTTKRSVFFPLTSLLVVERVSFPSDARRESPGLSVRCPRQAPGLRLESSTLEDHRFAAWLDLLRRVRPNTCRFARGRNSAGGTAHPDRLPVRRPGLPANAAAVRRARRVGKSWGAESAEDDQTAN